MIAEHILRDIAGSPLHKLLSAQPAVLIGLIAHLVATPLQDDIVRTADRLLRLCKDILATSAARTALPGPEIPEVEKTYREIARLSRGAYCRFDSGAAHQLGELLRAVAAYASGGLDALGRLAANKDGPAMRLLEQLK